MQNMSVPPDPGHTTSRSLHLASQLNAQNTAKEKYFQIQMVINIQYHFKRGIKNSCDIWEISMQS